MTKRFTLEMQYWKTLPQGRQLVDNVTGEKGFTVEELCDIASGLHCQVEELQSAYEVYREANNVLEKENEQLKAKLKRYMEIELLKAEDFANCHNCKNDRSVHDGMCLDGMCAIKELMNIGGYFDAEYHKLPKRTICPYWELEE